MNKTNDNTEARTEAANTASKWAAATRARPAARTGYGTKVSKVTDCTTEEDDYYAALEADMGW